MNSSKTALMFAGMLGLAAISDEFDKESYQRPKPGKNHRAGKKLKARRKASRIKHK